jgi:predicted transcriptional regulator
MQDLSPLLDKADEVILSLVRGRKQQILRICMHKKYIYSSTISQVCEISQAHASENLKHLHSMKLLTRENVGQISGGVEYRYTYVLWRGP